MYLSINGMSVRLKESQKEFHEAAEQILLLKKGNDRLEGANSELTEKVTALISRKKEVEEVSSRDNCGMWS